MSGYVYRVERLSRLLKSEEKVLRLVRQFGPPSDYPQPMLEKVRKQLPAAQAVYRLECVKKPPRLQSEGDGPMLKSVLLRIPERNALFAEVTRLPDARIPANGVVYFGVDEAVSPTNRLSPNLFIPYEKIDVRVGDEWLPLDQDALERIAG